uniref:Uncharacterized protein n=1 Tax=Trichogramma kaykai TaxID=54128 RepID=A0ABD2X512_9HYME
MNFSGLPICNIRSTIYFPMSKKKIEWYTFCKYLHEQKEILRHITSTLARAIRHEFPPSCERATPAPRLRPPSSAVSFTPPYRAASAHPHKNLRYSAVQAYPFLFALPC